MLILVTLLASCAADEPRPVLRQPSGQALFMPFVARDISSKKGVGLFAGGCDVLDKLNVSWYYTGPQECEGYERVTYLSHPAAMGREPTPSTLVLNEQEYQPGGMERLMPLFVDYAERYPDVTWVGPCPAHDLDLIPAFWAEFERQAGYAMPPERIRICVHCYYGADECMRLVNEAAQLGDSMGIPQPAVWLTEFGQILGLNMTIGQHVGEMRMLVNALETDSRVERYAYWPGLLRPGLEVPDGRPSAWQPLAHDFYGFDLNTIIGVQLSNVGEMYAGY